MAVRVAGQGHPQLGTGVTAATAGLPLTASDSESGSAGPDSDALAGLPSHWQFCNLNTTGTEA
jgi:hypothetical protein